MRAKTFNESEQMKTRKFAINNFHERHVQKRNSHITPKLAFKVSLNDNNKHRSKLFQKTHQKVRVLIHEVHGYEGSQTDQSKPLDTNKIDVPIEMNQTEIIYSVIIGKPNNWKAVLASTAAEDMRLVKNDEVAKILENEIFLKAERKSIFNAEEH